LDDWIIVSIVTSDDSNQEYQRGDGTIEGGNSEWQCSYDGEEAGMYEAFWLQLFNQ